MTIVVAVRVAGRFTLGPALIPSIVTRFGKVLEPKGNGRARGWRRLGAATVRPLWPGAVLVMGIVLMCMVGAAGAARLPHHLWANDRILACQRSDVPANVGYAASDRHFSDAKMNPRPGDGRVRSRHA